MKKRFPVFIKVLFISILHPFLVATFILVYLLLFDHQGINTNRALFFLACVLTLFLAKPLNLLKIRAEKISLKEAILSVLFAIGIYAVGHSLFQYIKLSEVIENERELTALHLFFVLIFAPVFEEIFIKSVLMESLLSVNISKVFTVLFVSIYFTFLHYPEIHTYQIVLGFSLALLYLYKRNVILCIATHFFYNLVSTSVFNFL